MIIEKLSQKYKINSGKGINILKKKNILVKLNMIIEWEVCKIPEGDEQELKPGDCFLLDGESQLIAVNDNDSLILLISESGPLALERIFNEYFKTEISLMFGDLDPDTEIVWKSVSKIPQECTEIFTPEFSYYKVFKNKFIKGRGFLENFTIEVNYISNDFLGKPLNLYFLPWKIKYDPNEIPKEMIGYAVSEILCWFYREEERIVPVISEQSIENNEEEID